ncbi:MAG: NAD(P)/FAD-dependent oxidoreductase [Pseudomonadales bacterium]|nr:NAD(P)/FAD-dependent oxidoreductase [Pseudomonadales bacterium]
MTSQPPITPGVSTEVKKVDVAIVGAGFGGLGMAIKLLEEGNRNFVILEKANEVGGTWRDNSYPGCACDVQSHMYSFSFEGNPDWSKRYAPWNEIQNYILHCVDKYQLRPFIHFNQELAEAHFDENEGHWEVTTKKGTKMLANHVVVASGPLHVPQVPKLKGLDTFKGKIFHSAQWDHNYNLKGKKVASIGTGGSAIQYVPEIAPDVDQLHVFQRTAAWVIPRDERKYLGIEKLAFKRLPALRKLHRARLYWSNESRVWPMFNPALAKGLSALAKQFIKLQVKDPETARKLTPDYTMGCKRILISNKYFPTFNRDNVALVTESIQEVREHSIVTRDGVEREVDCIILGTGFVVDPRIYMSQLPVTGIGGIDLRDEWKDAAVAYKGINVAGFPNFHLLVGPNTGLGHNSIIFMIESQVNHILDGMKKLKAKKADYFDVKKSAQEAFVDEVQEKLKGTVWTSGCSSWYQQADGKNTALWPGSTWRYWLTTLHLNASDFVFMKAKSKTALGSKKKNKPQLKQVV